MRLISALIAIAVLMGSCSLSPYPIDDPAIIKMDSAFLGKWVARDKDGSTETYMLTRKDNWHYNVLELAAKKKDQHKYSAALSEINGSRFLNVYCKDDSTEGYLFIRILSLDKEAGKVTATAFNVDTLKNAQSTAAVRGFITANLDNSAMYSDTVILVRVKN